MRSHLPFFSAATTTTTTTTTPAQRHQHRLKDLVDPPLCHSKDSNQDWGRSECKIIVITPPRPPLRPTKLTGSRNLTSGAGMNHSIHHVALQVQFRCTGFTYGRGHDNDSSGGLYSVPYSRSLWHFLEFMRALFPECSADGRLSRGKTTRPGGELKVSVSFSN